MKHFLAFLKATLLGGVIVVFPAWLAVLLVLKALAHLEVFVKPISKHLPGAIGHPRVIAIVLLVAVCFAVGLLIQTALKWGGGSDKLLAAYDAARSHAASLAQPTNQPQITNESERARDV